MRWSRADLAALRALPLRELALLPLVALTLLVAHLLLRTAGYNRTLAAGARTSPRPGPGVDHVRAAGTARLVSAVDRRLPGSRTCLSRSLALWYLLRLRRLASEIRIGVRPGAVSIDAHAWVEHDGRPLNDDDDVAARYGLLERRSPHPA